ncbi:hypothetical protein CRUP_027811 [Coryphaenoides rupestris]|nr:hypothetical protein CRUP_027811 [Coryphaenoides rupestris]
MEPPWLRGIDSAAHLLLRYLGDDRLRLAQVTETTKHLWKHSGIIRQFKRFHREIIAELERKTDLDVKYMTATYKRYQMEHKMKQDSLERSQRLLQNLGGHTA